MNQVYRDRHCSDIIGVVTPFGDGWRIMSFRCDGPSGHVQFDTREQMESELARWWRPDPDAGQVLDDWSRTDEWERGLKSCEFIRAWNFFQFHGRGDLSSKLNDVLAENGIDAALAHIKMLQRRCKMENECELCVECGESATVALPCGVMVCEDCYDSYGCCGTCNGNDPSCTMGGKC